MIFTPWDTSGTVRCATQKVAISNDLEQEGSEHFRLAIRFSLLFSFNGVPTIISVFIDDDDDGKSFSLLTIFTHTASGYKGLKWFVNAEDINLFKNIYLKLIRFYILIRESVVPFLTVQPLLATNAWQLWIASSRHQ